MGETITEIVNKIDRGFFKDEEEMKKTLEGVTKILNDFFESRDLNETTKDVITFLEKIWEHFSIGKYTKIFIDFAGAEKALYGLGESYRDHLIHVFNVFVMGILVFSNILKQDSGEVFKLLKIRKESKKVPFQNKYNEWRRLYYIWCLMSTFHDIAIPIDYRKEILEGFNRFLSYFKMETERLPLEVPFMIQFDFSRYYDLMVKMFAHGVVMGAHEELPTYQLPQNFSALALYFRSTLTNAINRYDHGVLGAYYLFKSIEEMFLSGRNSDLKYDPDLSAVIHNGNIVSLPKNKLKWHGILSKLDLSDEQLNGLPRVYDLSRKETKYYNDYVFEQDVTRAALAISLHHLDPSNDPKIFPISFSKLPLSFLLILFDELQEFYRPEGLVLTEIVRFHKFPQIDTNVKVPSRNKPHIQITLNFNLEKLCKDVEEQVVNKYKEWARKKMII
jgi:hypothetical protein